MLGSLNTACVSSTASRKIVPVQVAALDPAVQGDRTIAPLSFVRFCMDNGQECRSAGDAGARIRLTPETMSRIESVNADVNRRIRPIVKSGPLNIWRINPASGDCNDYVVTKRHELIGLGLPASALLIAVVRTSAGEGHLVLVANTDQGELVLDNLTSQVLPREQTSLTWVMRQSASNPQHFETV